MPMPQFQPLISTDELAAAIDRPNVRIFDCTTFLEPPPPGSDAPYEAVPGRQTFEEAHIPGPTSSTCKENSPTGPCAIIS